MCFFLLLFFRSFFLCCSFQSIFFSLSCCLSENFHHCFKWNHHTAHIPIALFHSNIYSACSQILINIKSKTENIFCSISWNYLMRQHSSKWMMRFVFTSVMILCKNYRNDKFNFSIASASRTAWRKISADKNMKDFFFIIYSRKSKAKSVCSVFCVYGKRQF